MATYCTHLCMLLKRCFCVKKKKKKFNHCSYIMALILALPEREPVFSAARLRDLYFFFFNSISIWNHDDCLRPRFADQFVVFFCFFFWLRQKKMKRGEKKNQSGTFRRSQRFLYSHSVFQSWPISRTKESKSHTYTYTREKNSSIQFITAFRS